MEIRKEKKRKRENRRTGVSNPTESWPRWTVGVCVWHDLCLVYYTPKEEKRRRSSSAPTCAQSSFLFFLFFLFSCSNKRIAKCQIHSAVPLVLTLNPHLVELVTYFFFMRSAQQLQRTVMKLLSLWRVKFMSYWVYTWRLYYNCRCPLRKQVSSSDYW